MRNTNICVAILVAIALLTSCSNGSSGKNTIVLVDISKSIKPEVLDWYIQTIEKDICVNLSQFDKIKILPIDGSFTNCFKSFVRYRSI